MSPRVFTALTALAALTAGCGADEPGPCGPVEVCEAGATCFPEGCDVAARCASGPEARLYGRAGAEGGSCVVVDDATCRASMVTCPIWGQCSAPPADWAAPGACPPTRAERDFQASRDLRCAGRATCVALDDADCRAARVCDLDGRCAAERGVCLAKDEADCRASELCADLGACSLHRGFCRARSVDDCLGSKACEDRGECGPRGGRCVACAKSDACRADGLCAFAEGRCRATRDVHCRASAGCKQHGRCVQDRGRCVTAGAGAKNPLNR